MSFSSGRRRPMFVPAVLCVLLGLAVPHVSAYGEAPGTDGGSLGAQGAGAEVAKLYEEAADATRRYEEGRRQAGIQRAEASELERRLAEERRGIAILHADLGRIARAQYRTGGDVPYTARMLLADRPEDVMNSQRAGSQAELAVRRKIDESRAAERRLAEDEKEASQAWRALESRNDRLAELRQEIEEKLERAQWRLRGEADRSVAAGRCRGAVRLPRSSAAGASDWVAPVAGYQLSAGFGGSGQRWASRHTGQDFAVGVGTPVRAVGEGRVVSVSCGGAFGIAVVLQHPGGYYTQYAHLSSAAVDQGERVAVGQWIGLSGTTGNSTGPHLHFEVRLTPQLGSGVDPMPWLAERGVVL
ncbi:M23 family metallopeptidase [Streptomyces uncialis]|uniref:M23 family metallopeptidase n=1 Tax=Streptomyces uncialis TaxID=1048205 RepID=UPI002258D934|nr:peptidoglycan DD-metalloendopeptidase family protein [Streptomyces uncialis]MCX4664959.1 peptidoglycan DD-metalloendopeptidase family protein [Streptomyces uncialis]